MKVFETPVMEVVVFSVEDIMTVSGDDNLGENDTEWG